MYRKIYQSSRSFKSFLFVLAILIILVLLFYTQHLVQSLRAETRQVLEFYAQFYARAVSEADDAELNFIFEEIIKRTDFPIILTDDKGNPTGWKGIDVDPTDFSPEAIKRVRRLMKAMEKETKPIPLTYNNITFNYLYYGDSRAIQQLRWLPYAEILVISLFILVGFVGFNSIRRSEQQFIWVGMAKETAHQLGTPISSLMGWVELLKAKSSEKDQQMIVSEIQQDIQRLNKVAHRFSQIGSSTELKEHDLDQLIRGVIQYFERRLPQMGHKVAISYENLLQKPIPINPDLFEWVLENLIKNALDAIGTQQEGKIDIIVKPAREKKYHAIIEIRDNGKGIEPQLRKRIFQPGFSSKKRGWGLGLSLARRIVTGYHGGKLILKESQPGVGSVFQVIL
ncbi:MAG: sensor histidine kinase [Calditrichaeota bacterium]|nr:MAG: sensor histidine kinase [Calditrichota bacterium]